MNSRVPLAAFACLAALSISAQPATAWDPIGDITHPDRIVRNVGRTLDDAGRTVDRWRIEAQSQTAAPAFEAWLVASRNTSMNGAQPVPAHIASAISGQVDADALAAARFRVGDRGSLNLANLSIKYGDARAVTLIDVIVFETWDDANDPALWVHELKHVEQFREWGVRDFAIRYLRSWNSVEDAAYAAENRYQPVQVSYRTPQSYPYQPLATYPARQAPGLSTKCWFTTGYRFGQVIDYAPMAPLPVGFSCQDGMGSFGYVVP